MPLLGRWSSSDGPKLRSSHFEIMRAGPPSSAMMFYVVWREKWQNCQKCANTCFA